MNGTRLATAALVVGVLCAAPAHAQISGFSVTKNAGNSADSSENGLTAGTQRKSVVTIQSITPDAGQARYAAIVGADTGIFTSRTVNMDFDWNLNFNVTSPGAYILHMSTSLNGAFTLVDDGLASASADMSAIVATQTGATVLSGSLAHPDPGLVNSNSTTNLPFASANLADFWNTSNGIAKAHSFRFTWDGNCISNSSLTGGDECAIRLGLPVDAYGGESAGDYPGQGGRVQADDGHFVSVQVEHLCGNGTIDAAYGEQCDQGQFNGSSCCSATCQLMPAGHACRPAADVCDVAELCDGLVGSCPFNTFVAGGTLCRASAGVCDVQETCTGFSAPCPLDAKRPNSFVCRPSTDLCDLADTCDGVTNDCPPDAPKPNGAVCRTPAGGCDIVETCDGVAFTCPADVIQSAGVECRAIQGVCDIAEQCDGSSVTCPVDAKSTGECRPVSGDCDSAENCNGLDDTCPPDVFLGSHGGSFICRASLGGCDPAEECDGLGPNCPADVIHPNGTVCRALAGNCDIVETCDGSSTACPADVVEPSGTLCRATAGSCDVAETCTGASGVCPADAFLPATTVCRPAVGICDVDENCTGTGAVCPPDVGEPDSDADTVCDPDDNCIAIPNTDQADADADDIGDLCDGCSNILNVQTSKTRLVLSKLATPPGDDQLKFKGEMVIPVLPELDLIAKGARVIIDDNAGNHVFDATIPPGLFDVIQKAGWKGNGTATIFKYKNTGPTLPAVGGIKKLTIRKKTTVPGLVKFAVAGKQGSYTYTPGNLPLRAMIIVEGPLGLHNQCGEAFFNGTPPAPSCTTTSDNNKVRCQ